jgi:hypothetical protein
MSEPADPPLLQDLVDAFERGGAATLGELARHPVLVQCDAQRSQQNFGFNTVAISAPWDLKVALGLAQSGLNADAELLAKAGAVHAVAKRPGGPFPDRIGVGRSRTADVFVRVSSASKYHAYFHHNDERGCWELWDARSRNGTTVGKQRLEPGAGVAVENGTNIMLGEGLFLFFTSGGFLKLVKGLAGR